MNYSENKLLSHLHCRICDVKLPRITLKEYKAFVCFCQRNQTNPNAFARDLIEAGAVFCCVTGKRKN